MAYIYIRNVVELSYHLAYGILMTSYRPNIHHLKLLNTASPSSINI